MTQAWGRKLQSVNTGGARSGLAGLSMVMAMPLLVATGMRAQTAAPPTVGAPGATSASPQTQAAPAAADPAATTSAPATTNPATTTPAAPAAASTPAVPPPTTQTIEVPAGTRILLALKSGINTKTARPGDPVYLSSTFPVIVKDRVVMPSGVDVQGVIDKVVRPGRVKGRAQVTMHFTTLIFPSGTVVSVPGTVEGVPGSNGAAVNNKEGTIEEPGSKGKDVGTVATGAAGGAALGGIVGSSSGHSGAGVGYGALAGGVGGLLYTLFTRGSDIDLEQGQTIEMVFQRPLTLEEKDIVVPIVPTQQYNPVPPKPPLSKPSARSNVPCPLGVVCR